MDIESQQFHHQTASQPINVVALHCSLSTGQQWSKLRDELGTSATLWTPDLAGYGVNVPFDDPRPYRLDTEVELLAETLTVVAGPIHLIGHSYGGAVAFKLATSAKFKTRIASLTLIEPVLPSILLARPCDRRLYEDFALEAARICTSLWGYDRVVGLQRFLEFWNGPGCWDALSSVKRQSLLERVYKLAADFTAIFGEADVASLAAGIIAPTLLFSGTRSPFATQRIVERLSTDISNARSISVPAAGHMLAITHAAEINAHLVRNIRNLPTGSRMGNAA